MLIYGFQKLTLLDFPERTACTVFTGGCNLRCPFCHNALLAVDPSALSVIPESEVFELLNKRKETLDGVCITGGEPMLMKDLPEFAEKIKSLGFLVKIDTNGTFPDKLKSMVNAGLADYVAMDVKNTPSKYGVTVGRIDFDTAPIIESIDFLKSSSVEHEFRTTVCRDFHTVDDVVSIAKMLGSEQRYFLQSFKNSGMLINNEITGYSDGEMRDILAEVKRIIPGVALRGV